MAATAACAFVAARRISFAIPVACVLGGLGLLALALSVAFLRTLNGRLAKSIEAFSAIWTVLLYLTLGVVPLWVSLS
jgi:4-hydroxybenzoate polyprenyltransferase